MTMIQSDVCPCTKITMSLKTHIVVRQDGQFNSRPDVELIVTAIRYAVVSNERMGLDIECIRRHYPYFAKCERMFDRNERCRGGA